MSDRNINTFVVIDLETNGLPSLQYNTCAITEISLYAFSAKCLVERDIRKDLWKAVDGGFEWCDPLPPELPRVLNKMTLMVNPRRMIDPSAERVTGLSNEMLEHESPFDENSATCLNLFLERLEQPACLVAYNGWQFDYPIIRYLYDKLKMSLPPSIYCVDSLKAFRELDEKFEQIENNKKQLTMLEADKNDKKKLEIELDAETVDLPNTSVTGADALEQNSKIDSKLNNETTPEMELDAETAETVDLPNSSAKGADALEPNSKIDSKLNNETTPEMELDAETVDLPNSSAKDADALEQNSKIDWKLNNETTPQRKVNNTKSDDNLAQTNLHVEKRSVSLSARRSLFADDFKPKTKYPPRGVYKLGKIYKRCFNQEPINLHRAESDVEILTKLILHYGLDFLAYCEERKRPFAKVPKLGSSI